MAAPKMHADEVDIDAALVRRLLLAQFPHIGDAPLEPVRSIGTVNAIFRLGDDLCVRLPRVERWASSLARELKWLPKLAPRLSLRVPEPVARGEPGCGYPFPWAVYGWLDGETYAGDRVRDEREAAPAWLRSLPSCGASTPPADPHPVAGHSAS